MRPKFHYTSQNNWINCPCGLVYYKGQYHLYYQHNPESMYWGRMCWGHATSTDLSSWTEHPVFLKPSRKEDRDGCFSGSAIAGADGIFFAYSGIAYKETITGEHGNELPASPSDIQAVMLFGESKDGYELEKNRELLVTAPDGISPHQFRDPKLFQEGYRYYFVAGAVRGENSVVLFYVSEDLKSWKLVKEVVIGSEGAMVECPDYFVVNGQGILVYSSIQMSAEGKLSGVGTMTIDLETGIIGKESPLDLGNCFYAPHTLMSKSGKRVMVGWLRMLAPFEGENWTGMLSVPRVLSYWDGALRQLPHLSLNSYAVALERVEFRGDTYTYSNREERASFLEIFNYTDPSKSGWGELILEMNSRNRIDMRAEGGAMIVETLIDGKLTRYEIAEMFHNMKIVKDAHCVEIFVNDGKYVLSDIYEHIGETYKYVIRRSEGIAISGAVKDLSKRI